MGGPSTIGRCSRHAAAVLSNEGVGTADQWERGKANTAANHTDISYLLSGCGRP